MVSKKIFDLKQEILEIAPAKSHKWKDTDFSGNEDVYGKGDAEYYGHVKLISDVDQISSRENDSNGVSVAGLRGYVNSIQQVIRDYNNINDEGTNNYLLSASVIKQYVTDKITQLLSNLTTDDITIEDQGTLTDKISSIDRQIEENYNPNNIDFSSPKRTNTTSINDLIEPGYYQYDLNTELPYFEDDKIYCKDAIITVEGQPDGTILQYIYPTNPERQDDKSDEYVYKLNGKKFLRIYKNGNWSSLSLVYTPQSTIETSYANNEDVTNGINITITETTAGFTFNWQHTNNDDDSYIIKKEFYEYETLCIFPSIPIGRNPYIFGNLIGKVDVKIDKNSMSVRSTLSNGSKVKNVNTTLFVPRIEE